MEHDIAMELSWCKRCGLSRMEIMEAATLECQGNSGVIHERYLKALREFRAFFGPILKEVERLSQTVTKEP